VIIVMSLRMSSHNNIWHRPPGIYALPQDETHVWRASLAQPPDYFAPLMHILSPEERARADKFHFEVDRKRYVLARGLLPLLLGHCLGRPAKQLQFQYGEFGKPRLARGLHPFMQFNLSHSGDLVLIALSRRALGVDIERIRTNVATGEIAAGFFSADESRDLATLALGTRCAAFFAYWTGKEAHLKARGDGLSLPPEKFDVSFFPETNPSHRNPA
jgi:4'-phosphopantetheinyl transferase